MTRAASHLAGSAKAKSANQLQKKSQRHGVLDTGRAGFEPTWHYWALFRLLQISPSYWLAHQHSLTRRKPETLPAEYDAVRHVYELLGPLWEIPFWVWWRQRAHPYFRGEEIVEQLARSKATDIPLHEPIDVDVSAVDRLILSIPLVGTRTSLLKQVDALLVANSDGWAKKQPVAGYRVIKDRTQRGTVNDAIRTVQARALFGDTLQMAGERSRYKRNPSTKESLDPRDLLEMTSRHSTRARRWAENAARGRFPCLDKEPSKGAWPAFEPSEMKDRLESYARVSEAALAAIPERQRRGEDRYAGWNRTLFGKA